MAARRFGRQFAVVSLAVHFVMDGLRVPAQGRYRLVVTDRRFRFEYCNLNDLS